MSAEDRPELGPLPPGRHRFTREQVSHNQRERLIAALSHVVNERGYQEATVADITTAAQVSRRTFYENFSDKEDCFLATFDVVVAHLRNLIADAVEPIEEWPQKVAAGVRALLGFFDAERELAHLCLVDALSAGPKVAARYRSVVLSAAPALHAGRGERSSSTELPDSTEDTLMGGMASVLARSLISGEKTPLADLAPDFTVFLLAPYLGQEKADEFSQSRS